MLRGPHRVFYKSGGVEDFISLGEDLWSWNQGLGVRVSGSRIECLGLQVRGADLLDSAIRG